MFFDEEMLLDLRLNILDKYVHKFVITEANYMHNGEPKKLIFNIDKFSKFKDKIIYIVVDKVPPNLEKINKNDSEEIINAKKQSNAYKRHIYQLEETQLGILDAGPDDIIIISDLDEIPNLEKVDFKNIKEKLIFFKQKMFYYKLNLYYKLIPWYGSKACKKKHLKSARWIQWIKNKKYPLWRLDILFSKEKYHDIHFIADGGWHFTNIKSPSDIEKKLLNYTHHYEFEQSGLTVADLHKKILEKKIIYDHSVDQREFKWDSDKTLTKIELSNMPTYLRENSKKYANWLE